MARKKTLQRDAIVEEARKRFDYAVEVWTPIYDAAREDMRFSDPTDPQQWPEDVKRDRKTAQGGPRPCLVFDQTQQFVRQVINTARRNKPALTFLPVDDESDLKMADVLKGLARQTEYASRAEVSYITALDQATRGGIGYFRLVLEEEKGSEIRNVAAKKRAEIFLGKNYEFANNEQFTKHITTFTQTQYKYKTSTAFPGLSCLNNFFN